MARECVRWATAQEPGHVAKPEAAPGKLAKLPFTVASSRDPSGINFCLMCWTGLLMNSDPFSAPFIGPFARSTIVRWCLSS